MPVEATLVFLLQTLKEELREHKNLRGGKRHEFELLQDELRLFQAFLGDSASKYEKNEVFKEFERRIRELVYEVEDTIDICLSNKAAAKNKNIFARSAHNFSMNMAKQVNLLRQHKVKPMVDAIASEFPKLVDSYRSHVSSEKQETKDSQLLRQEHGIIIHDDQLGQPSLKGQSNNNDKIVDFRDEATVIGYLMKQTTQLDIISITGMPGQGKTTFAMKIFEHECIVREFPLRIWIPVSKMFKCRDVFVKILEKITSKEPSSPSNDDELIPTIRARLDGKKFLLVMDDVWTIDDWEELQTILPENGMNGKVLVTTRENKVAVHVNVDRNPHLLSNLGEKESLELLKLKVFNNLEKCPRELEEVGQAIADKCNGSPLLILVIGGILKDIFTKTKAPLAIAHEWREVLENVAQNFEEDEKKLISKVLELMYTGLTHDMRVCLLYTGLFPEYHEIPASTLTKLWIAEGFIQKKDRKSIEETANDILESLISKNLLGVAQKNLEHVKTCRVHDMIRGFCISKAREENFFRMIRLSKEGVVEPPIDEVPDFRRICLHSNPSTFLSKNPNGPRVRSFLCFFDEPCQLNPTQNSTIPNSFNKLRVLNCKSIKFIEFPKVTGLILLKHITLSIDNLNIIPKEISKLVNLQTLIVDTNSSSVIVKANIWKMFQLRHVKAKAAISLDGKKWKGRACENLQTISRLSPEFCEPTLVVRAPNLKTLGIRGKLANLFDTFSVGDFNHLEKLKLVNDLIYESAYENPLHYLPQSNRFPPNLKRLTLSNTYLKWDRDMPILAKINTLMVLKLKDYAFTGPIWRADGEVNGFQDLQFLLIKKSKLVTWKATTNNFPSLRWLVIKKCDQLQRIPVSLAETLEKLEIEHVKTCATVSAKEIESIKKRSEENKQTFGVPFSLIVGPSCDL